MRTTFTSALCFLTILLLSLPAALHGQSGTEFERTAVHNGNQVRTVFGNWGVIGQPANKGPRGAWKSDNNGYLGDVSPLIGAEVGWQDTVFHSVVTCPFRPTYRPTAIRDEDPLTGKYWTFEPVGGYLNANQERIAMSTDRNSWPPEWPDKLNDPSDPGWKGSWNGYFGKRISADQESYFVMDDNNDERFNAAANNPRRIAFKPDGNNTARNGLALEVRVRGLQWAQFLAKDNIFWLYEITNTGTTNYNRAVFGMLVGTYCGVTGTDDNPREFDDDWSFYDVVTNITYTGDFGRNVNRNPLWIGRIGMVGYAFLESPGNPFDGIDNDGDADTLLGSTAPLFVQTRFDSTLIMAGMQLVLIRDDFSRYAFTVPNDTVTVYTRGKYTLIRPGITKVAEGNIVRDFQGNESINRNSYDGIDNDFDGVIDENYYLHYRQIKRTRTTPPVTLIDVLRPVRYIDHISNLGTNPLSSIDEKRNDLIDNDGDWIADFDDVGRDGIPGTNDFGENDGQPTSGYDVLGNDTGLPGEPNIDKTDIDESDQIGLTSFNYFTPSNQIRLGDDESLWLNLAPGFFDVPRSIVNNRPESGEDGDFVYGSGYFPLLAGATERFSLALVYGGGKGGSVEDDITDLLRNKRTVQDIYDANYQFPQPPDLPTLTAVPGDRQVTLYWDRKAEASLDPVLKIRDFEGYKIYRSTDPDFSDIFTITDATGSPQGYRPLVQFDLANQFSGVFQANAELYEASAGYPFKLGENTGLQHTYVDRDLDNGRRYYYALVAYDRGDETIGIFPGENTKFISILPSGEILKDINVQVVVPNAKTGGYRAPDDAIELTRLSRIGTGTVMYGVVDETRITGHTYRMTFLDTQVDTIDNNGNRVYDAADSTEWGRTTSFYFVKDLNPITETFTIQDTIPAKLSKRNIDPATVIIRNEQGSEVPPALYHLDAVRGEVRPASPGSLPNAKYTADFQYYPVFRSPHMQGTPFLTESKDADIFDGIELFFENDWLTQLNNDTTWVGDTAYIVNFSALETNLGTDTIRGYKRPADYEFQFADGIVDTSYPDPLLYPFATPVNFRIYNRTEDRYIKFIFADADVNGKISPNDEIVFTEENPRGGLSYSWDVRFINKVSDPPDTVYDLGAGDKLLLKTKKPIRSGDLFEFTTVPPRIEYRADVDYLGRIRVVPNPYVTASSFELPLNPGITSGRGERKVDFIHLPPQSKIQIFTSRGEHVITLSHDGDIEDGSVSWNLRTKENLDVSYGVYFYVVESPVGTKTGKLAIIK